MLRAAAILLGVVLLSASGWSQDYPVLEYEAEFVGAPNGVQLSSVVGIVDQWTIIGRGKLRPAPDPGCISWVSWHWNPVHGFTLFGQPDELRDVYHVEAVAPNGRCIVATWHHRHVCGSISLMEWSLGAGWGSERGGMGPPYYGASAITTRGDLAGRVWRDPEDGAPGSDYFLWFEIWDDDAGDWTRIQTWERADRRMPYAWAADALMVVLRQPRRLTLWHFGDLGSYEIVNLSDGFDRAAPLAASAGGKFACALKPVGGRFYCQLGIHDVAAGTWLIYPCVYQTTPGNALVREDGIVVWEQYGLYVGLTDGTVYQIDVPYGVYMHPGALLEDPGWPPTFVAIQWWPQEGLCVLRPVDRGKPARRDDEGSLP